MLILAVISFLIYQGISHNLVYYITPSELLSKGKAAYGQSFRLGGQVKPGSIHWNGNTQILRFVLQDADPKKSVVVVSKGIPPDTFRAGAGAVVEGTYTALPQSRDPYFSATNLMVKHDETYQAPKPGDTPVPDNFQSGS